MYIYIYIIFFIHIEYYIPIFRAMARPRLSPLRGSVAAQLAEAPDQLVTGGSLSSRAAAKIRNAGEAQKNLAKRKTMGKP